MDNTINFSDVDYTKIDPEKLDLGTCNQTCALICQTYERGAHNTYKESAVFATLNRLLENSNTFASSAVESLQGYIRQPAQSVSDTQSTGTDAATEATLQGMKIGNTDVSTVGDAFGKSLMDWMKNCIPCQGRLLALLELHPHIDLLGALEADLKARLAMLMDLANLFSNIDIYADLCALLSLLNFMCIPDLQRLIAMFVALLANMAFELDGLIGILQGLIAPLFAPIMMAITSLLDQFSLTVLSPVDCIIDAIDEQLRKMDYEIAHGASEAVGSLKGGMAEMKNSIIEAKNFIKQKLQFYIDQVKAMLGELGFGDVAYLKASLKKLFLIRMIGFIIAVIAAISKGQAVCSPGKTPEASELDNFFNNFMNPNSSFNMWVDDQGNIRVDEKVPLSNDPNMLTFEGDNLLNSELVQQIQQTAAALTQTTSAKIPCRLEVQAEDVSKVNRWVAELDSI